MTGDSMAKHKSKLTIECILILFLTVVLLASPAMAEDPLSDLADRMEKLTPQEQITQLQEYIDSGINDARVHFFLGNAYFAIEQYDSAVVQYATAIEIDEKYAKAYVNMGTAYDTKGDFRRARDAYEKALAINPNDVLAYCHLGFNYYSNHEPDRAMELYAKALEIDPNSAQAHYNLGLAFANAKIFKEALLEWNKVIELDPDGQLGKIAAENVDLIETYMELEK
jgi:tetratricopeptide (TPR) repeat protein